MSEDSVFGPAIETTPAHDVMGPPIALEALAEHFQHLHETVALSEEHKDAFGNLANKLERAPDDKPSDQQIIDVANKEIQNAKAAIISAMAMGSKHNPELGAALQELNQLGTVSSVSVATAAIALAKTEESKATETEAKEITEVLGKVVVEVAEFAGGAFNKIFGRLSEQGIRGGFESIAVNEALVLGNANHGLGARLSTEIQQQMSNAFLQRA